MILSVIKNACENRLLGSILIVRKSSTKAGMMQSSAEKTFNKAIKFRPDGPPSDALVRAPLIAGVKFYREVEEWRIISSTCFRAKFADLNTKWALRSMKESISPFTNWMCVRVAMTVIGMDGRLITKRN